MINELVGKEILASHADNPVIVIRCAVPVCQVELNVKFICIHHMATSNGIISNFKTLDTKKSSYTVFGGSQSQSGER